MALIGKGSKILVPLDGSKMAQKAFQHALRLAKAIGSDLVLLTVIPENVIPAATYKIVSHRSLVEKFTKEMYGIARQQATDLLEKNIPECEKQGVQVSYKILEGDAASEIICAAKQLKVSMIVIGSVGLTGVKRLAALGSVSRKVSELSDCPVLIVH